MSECRNNCDGIKDYTDGIFWYCYCEAQVMNIICDAHIKHKDSIIEDALTLEKKKRLKVLNELTKEAQKDGEYS